eukprot:gene6619-4739_t
MEQLIATKDAVEKLCEYLEQSYTSETEEEGVESLFTPQRSGKLVSVEVEITFIVSAPVHRVPLFFILPHSFMIGSICLITPPPQRSFKDKLQALVESGNDVAGRVSRVIDTKKLNEKVNTPVSSRAFANSYDNFVLYGVHRYPKQLTGEFFGHRKNPVWVTKKSKLDEALRNATRTVVVPRRGQNAVTCRVGHTGLPTHSIVENIESFVDQFTKHSQGAPLEHILHVRVTGTSAKDKRIGLTIYSHSFKISDSTCDESSPPKKRKTA